MRAITDVEFRPAILADAAAICAVVRASIIELCFDDHHGDAQILERWLANKTPETVNRWLANPDNLVLVAVEDGAILGASCVTTTGGVLLNYVAPAARFRGVSRALLDELEATARRGGATRCVLESTTTAHRFYLARGYVDSGAPGQRFGLTTYPMTKTL